MCGIAGCFDPGIATEEATLLHAARGMADALRHRGPDAEGVWVDAPAGIALAHRRLAVIDLSPTGDQPMTSASGRLVIVYNGEVFNAGELRGELEASGVRFRGHSDTEVVLEACEFWGIERTLGRLIGMFAFAIWDRRSRRLTLVRDRLGVKPLFWGWHGGVLLFASQPGALTAWPRWRAKVDDTAAAQYLRFGYVPAPLSIWSGIGKLRPGHLATIDADGKTQERCWWDVRAVAAEGMRAPLDLGESEAADMLHGLLRDAVGRRMAAEVPIGAFLSGGIDSSTVVALMQERSSRPVRTFTLAFGERDYDEAHHARAVAAHLGTDHTELRIEPEGLPELVPELSGFYDEPFADPCQLPALLLARLSRRSLTVALSGAGGDEVFAGYTRYLLAERLVRGLGRLPWRARSTAGSLIRRVPCAAIDAACAALPLPRGLRPVGDRAHKLAGLLDFRTPDELYARLVSISSQRSGAAHGTAFEDPGLVEAVGRFRRRMQLVDALTYLPDWALANDDRSSMATGLETRHPLLDHRLVEFGWRLPDRLLRQRGRGKWLLRRVLGRHVPRALFDRPKRGFEPPIGLWLRGPLRDWAEELLSPRRIAGDALLEGEEIRARLAEHLEGRRNWQYPLWAALMLQAWRARWT